MSDFQAWIDNQILDGVPILCERCPLCDKTPVMTVGPTQAFCGNDDCPALSWDMTRTRDDLILNARVAGTLP